MELKKRYTEAKRRLFDKVFGEKLNPPQCKAVFTTKGPLLVLAGAGSGKTTVLVNRISFLVKYGDAYFTDYMPPEVTDETVQALEGAVALPTSEIEEILPEFIYQPSPPWAVLAITFTNKAAREIKERLSATFNDAEVSEAIWAGTFHSVCLRILRKYGERLGYESGFSIYDTDDKKRLVTICMRELEIDEKRLAVRAVTNAISMAKDRLESCEDFEITHDPRSSDIKKIYTLYQKKLMEYNAVDFDDIIMKTVELLQKNEDVRSYYQNKFRYVLVDEYQDTNYAQFVLTGLLSGKDNNIMVVGDDDQSIYKFRGATVENILNFDKTYLDATVIKLEQNYRSTENILAAANAVIKNNGHRHDKKLWCDKGEGEKITLREAQDQNEEGKYIIDKINSGVKNGGRKYSDYAILYRVNELARSLETSFAKSGVPYKILGGMRFYDRKEVKDMIAYISIVNSKSDNLRLKRIINEPKRKIGAATVEAIESIATQSGISMFEVMRNAHKYEAFGKGAEKLKSFTELILSAGERCSMPSTLINELFVSSGYRDMLVAEGFEGEGKIDNVNELIAGAIEYEKRCEENEIQPTLSGFLEEITLVSDVDKYDESTDAVVLMTIHSAKGLEFPIVFLAGMEDGIFPSAQNIGNEEEMSEERRLAYVAITRAKEKLYITYTKNRTMYGKTNYNMLSGFIRCEVPHSLIERDIPKSPPRTSGYFPRYNNAPRNNYGYAPVSNNELARTPDIFGGARKSTESGSVKYGIKSLPVGSVVEHGLFGEGVILSAKDLAGDVLYEVNFKSVGTKKLMATFAKLTLKKEGIFKMIKLCIFDLDGTVLDTLSQIEYYINSALKLYGMPPLTTERVRAFVGNGGRNLVERALDFSGENKTKSPELYEEFYEKYLALYNSDVNYLVTPYDKIPEALSALKKMGIKLAIMSNKPHSTVELCVASIFGDVFDIVLGAKDGMPLKPNPTSTLAICESLSVSPSETLFFGDSEVDMETARAAGVRLAVGVLWGFRDKEILVKSGADRLLSSADEIPQLVNKLSLN